MRVWLVVWLFWPLALRTHIYKCRTQFEEYCSSPIRALKQLELINISNSSTQVSEEKLSDQSTVHSKYTVSVLCRLQKSGGGSSKLYNKTADCSCCTTGDCTALRKAAGWTKDVNFTLKHFNLPGRKSARQQAKSRLYFRRLWKASRWGDVGGGGGGEC